MFLGNFDEFTWNISDMNMQKLFRLHILQSLDGQSTRYDFYCFLLK